MGARQWSSAHLCKINESNRLQECTKITKCRKYDTNIREHIRMHRSNMITNITGVPNEQG